MSEIVEAVIVGDAVVAFQEGEREGRVDGRDLGIGCGRQPRPAGRVDRSVGDRTRETRFEEGHEPVGRSDAQGDVVGVDVLHVVRDLMAVDESPALDRVARERERERLRGRLDM